MHWGASSRRLMAMDDDWFARFGFGVLRWPKPEFEPEPGLPRPWPFWRDVWFWPALLIPGPIATAGWIFFIAIARRLAEFPDGWLYIALTMPVCLFLSAITLWIVWDSYRWNIPSRTLYALAGVVSSGIFLMYYCVLRQEWVMEAKRANRLKGRKRVP